MGHKLCGERKCNWHTATPLTGQLSLLALDYARPLDLFRHRTWHSSCRFSYLLGCCHVCHFWPGKEHRPAGSSVSGSTTSAQPPLTSGVWSLQPLTVSPPRLKEVLTLTSRWFYFFHYKLRGTCEVLTEAERWQRLKPKWRIATPIRSNMKRRTWPRRTTGTGTCCWTLPGRSSRGR